VTPFQQAARRILDESGPETSWTPGHILNQAITPLGGSALLMMCGALTIRNDSLGKPSNGSGLDEEMEVYVLTEVRRGPWRDRPMCQVCMDMVGL
jgi:hypothetical protein